MYRTLDGEVSMTDVDDKNGGSFSLNSFAVSSALFAVPVFLAKNDYGMEVFPQWTYQLVGAALKGFLLLLILELIYGAYRRCSEIGSYPGDELLIQVAPKESSKWKDSVDKIVLKNLALRAVVLTFLIYLFSRRL
jgi:hypothetical protein